MLQAHPSLAEELKKINQRLIDTVADFSDEEGVTHPDFSDKGIVVKCTFRGVSISADLKQLVESESVQYHTYSSVYYTVSFALTHCFMISSYLLSLYGCWSLQTIPRTPP